MIDSSYELKKSELERKSEYHSEIIGNPDSNQEENYELKSKNVASKKKPELKNISVKNVCKGIENINEFQEYQNDQIRNKEDTIKSIEIKEENLNKRRDPIQTELLKTNKQNNDQNSDTIFCKEEIKNSKERENYINPEEKHFLRQRNVKEMIPKKHKEYCHRCHKPNKFQNFLECSKCLYVFCRDCIHFYHYQIESVLDFEKYCKTNQACPCCQNLCSCNNCYVKRKKNKVIKFQEDIQIEGPLLEVIDYRKRKYLRSKLKNVENPQKKKKRVRKRTQKSRLLLKDQIDINQKVNQINQEFDKIPDEFENCRMEFQNNEIQNLKRIENPQNENLVIAQNVVCPPNCSYFIPPRINPINQFANFQNTMNNIVYFQLPSSHPGMLSGAPFFGNPISMPDSNLIPQIQAINYATNIRSKSQNSNENRRIVLPVPENFKTPLPKSTNQIDEKLNSQIDLLLVNPKEKAEYDLEEKEKINL